jgi:predicted metal-dependent hydrolase
MNETLNIEGLHFTIRRSARRTTVGITVERKGDLSVSIPDQADLAQVEAVVRRKLFWVFTKLTEKELLFHPAPEKEYVSGEGFLYLGRSYRLLLVDEEPGVPATPSLRLIHGRFVMKRTDQRRAPELFIHWYTQRARDWIERRSRQMAGRIGRNPASIRVRDLGNRWGSCNGKKGLYFHWRTICLPPSLVDYVIAHEMVHLLEPTHSIDFWKRLERVMPDCLERKQRLAMIGALIT